MEVGATIDARPLGRLEHGQDDRRSLGPLIGSSEQPVPASHGRTTDHALYFSVVQLERTVLHHHAEDLPSNCIIDEPGRVRVVDFGLVCDPGAAHEPVSSSHSEPSSQVALGESLARTGAALGTLAYMPFEQLEGRAADASGDQFALCVSLYEAVYGQRPFDWSNPYELTLALERGLVRPPGRAARAPARLWRILERGLAREPSQRWPALRSLRC